MTHLLRCAILLLCAVASGGAPSLVASQPSDAPPVVTGRERVEWDQDLLPDTDIRDYEFAVYVNEDRRPLRLARCAEEPGIDGFLCSAPMPALRLGRNVLEFVAVLRGIESERSEQTVVQYGATTSQTLSAEAARTAAGVETLIGGLQTPTDIALLPDGRLLVAERAGRVRVVVDDALVDEQALTGEDVDVADGGGLFALAPHPDFASNRYIYLAYTARLRAGRFAYRVVRAREVDNRLGEMAVIWQSAPVVSPKWISARFGPDQKLYVGVSGCDACEPVEAGVILRLNDDGTTPRDNAAASPVYVRDVGVPVSLAWSGRELWIADGSAPNLAILRQGTRVQGPVPEGRGAVVINDGQRNSIVLMALPGGRGVERFEAGDTTDAPLRAAAMLLPESATVHAAIQAPDGSIYLCASDGRSMAATLMRVAAR